MNHVYSKPGPLRNSDSSEDYGSLEQSCSETEVENSIEYDLKPSKLRRRKSIFLSILRILSSSVSNSSFAESSVISPSNPSGRKYLLSSGFIKNQLDPTIVHRTQFKDRPSIFSFENDETDFFQGILPFTATESSSNSAKLSIVSPRTGGSNRRPSIGLKLLLKMERSRCLSPGSNFLMSGSVVGESSSLENILTPIVEDVNLEVRAPESVPTFVTVERAAIAKIFLERYYEKLYSCHITPRSIRRHQVELFLYRNQSLSALEKGEIRQSLARDESEHLRHLRVMKSRKRNSIKEQDIVSSAYDVIKILGKGSFGVVRLVKEKYNDLNVFDSNQDPQRKRGNVCAMKVIRKSNMLQNSQEGHLHAERDFFVAAEGSRWIVPLITSFQDMENLYLVMEYMPGGDFLGLLIRENVLSEPVTKWYIAEIILCIEEAHNLHWIHRDIKPDNFLISASGHLKISDFGLAFDGHWSHDQSYFNNHRYSLITKLGLKVDGDSIDKQEGNTVAAAMKTAQMMMSGKVRHEVDAAVSTDSGGDLNWRNKNSNRSFARSVVGTSQYMAPEVVRGEIYDARCDWWSMAIILYECLYGHTPFIAEDGSRQQTKSNIVNHRSEFKFPQRPVVSRKCQDFIRSVIQEKENRLCSRKYRIKESQGNGKHIKDPAGQYVYPNDAEDIKAHKWFRDIQWDRLHLMIPPVVPKLKSLDDTCYFDDEGSVSDFSESVSETPYSQEDIVNILEPFNSEIKTLTQEYLELPYDSTRLKEFEKKIDQFPIVDTQKQNLKKLVKLNGRKERKRPRDILLRDKSIGPKVLKIRKEGAFLGYTYRRFNPGQYNVGGIFRRNRSSTFKRSKINCVS